MGLRLVKKSVNQDVPDTYHLFYADGAGTPGTDLTFFPWPEMDPAQPGIGPEHSPWRGVHGFPPCVRDGQTARGAGGISP